MSQTSLFKQLSLVTAATLSLSACNLDFSNPANDVLVATPVSTATTNEDTISSNITLTGTAADGVVLNVEIVTNPANGSLVYIGNTAPLAVTYVPSGDFNGSDSFQFRVSDENGRQSEPAVVNLIVTAVNDAPVFNTVSNQSVGAPGQAFSVTVSATDAEMDTLTYSSTGTALPAWASLNTATGEISGTPSGGGTTSGIEISANDGTTTQASNMFNLSVDTALPVHRWSLDETSWNGSPNEIIDSVGTIHGAAVGSATTTSIAKQGTHAGSFNGSGYANLGSTLNLGTGDFTVAFWMKTSATGTRHILNQRVICGHDEFWGFVMNSSAQIGFEVDDNNVNYIAVNSTAAIPVNNDNWRHIAGTRSGATITIYVDGVQTGSATELNGGTADLATTRDVKIGSLPCTAGQNYIGQVDDIKIWSSALTDSDIATLAQ